MPDKETAQIFAWLALGQIAAQQALERARHFRGGAAVAHGPGGSLMKAESAPDAEVVRVLHLAVHFDFLALDADVGDPVLAATVRATSHVELEVLIESGKTLFQLFDKPSRETFGFSDRKLAEFSTTASDRTSRKG